MFSAAYGIAAYQADKDMKPKDLVKRADQKMYIDKENYRTKN